MTAGPVVVVGGTGAVGRRLVELLAGDGDEVVVVGRDGNRAAEVAADIARRHGGGVTARRADVDRPDDRRTALAGAGLVVTCVERANVAVARDAFAEGAHVVDISASAGVLAGIVGLDDVARWNGRSAVVSVGLAPGLTNLLARASADAHAETAQLDIAVLLGLGEHHGPDAVRWTLAALAAPDRPAATRPAGPTRMAIPGFGVRTTHPFPFAHQDALRAALAIPVTTRLCFDSRALTAAAFAARPLLRRLPRRALVASVGAAGRAHLGSDRWAAVATALGPDGSTTTAHATGRGQSHATAAVTAHVVRDLLAEAVPPGTHHIDVLDATAALAAVEAAGIAVRLPYRHQAVQPASP